jgi:hypothetical protein
MNSGAHPPMGTGTLFLGGQSSLGMKLIIHLHLALRLRMHEAILLLHIHPYGVVLNYVKEKLYLPSISYHWGMQ